LVTSFWLEGIKFYCKAKTINKIHSPLAFKLVSQLFDFSKVYYHDSALESWRAQLQCDQRMLDIEDLGAGSQTSSQRKQRKVSDLARTSTSNVYKCRLLRNVALFFKPQSILEFGTNLGMATAYLQAALPSSKVTTVEGSSALATLAEKNFKRLNLNQIEVLNQDFDTFLLSTERSEAEFVYLDGNHRYDSTLLYFDRLWADPKTKVIVIDDINWSPDMTQAWKEIKAKPMGHTIDLFKVGIIFKDDNLPTKLDLCCIPRWLKPWQLGFFT